jgi:hypothetical protein
MFYTTQIGMVTDDQDQQVVSDYRELVEKLLKEAGVDRWKDLPDESRVKTNRAWGAVQREYIKQRKHKIAVLVWESRTGQNVDHQPGEDEFADAYPTEEEAQGEIEAADSVSDLPVQTRD